MVLYHGEAQQALTDRLEVLYMNLDVFSRAGLATLQIFAR